MSTAHRPTWDPAQARDVKGGSRQFSVRDMAAHTKLKFRQAGQTSVGDVARRDLRTELLVAEEEARNKKRKAEGKPPLPLTNGNATEGTAGDEANKRRKLLEEALELDKDDDDDEKEEATESRGRENGEEQDEESEEESDEEDETAELMRELEKIKKERAEEKARQEREQNASAAVAREAEIATSNPLLNLAAALGQSPGVNTTVPGTFSVKRRWDDDLIFKNQAANQKDKSGQFVNDLLRTEFHKKFMAKFIK
ncbi:Cwf15/Cwc15 cell cycle control protein [Suillus clintonianus]|uniref:Cwf15/Cwc15 cell cycle control protein n=1 Tax=Suillus clintonianus TaxID=1904413 RepID=UPI001B886FD3|nr:Cwf15/Cwc15 cell cycle control protein [Suillus clintonianus]KAG2147980.1 Cwf15/Cwc15 cell cycle control protein [Suillus clintonianus]